MPEAMRLSTAKVIVKNATGRQPITFYALEGGEGFYPYVILPFEGRTETLDAVSSGLVHMYRRFFEDGVTTAVYPEAKSFLFTGIENNTDVYGVVTRKRRYPGVPGQVEISIKTPYRGETKMWCVGLEDGDTGLVIVDDMISNSLTMSGHIEALEREGYPVHGGLSVYERGEGLETLRGRFPDKTFAGFARLEIGPRNEKAHKAIERDVGVCDDAELIQRYMQHVVSSHKHLLYENGSEMPEEKRKKEFEGRVFRDINERLRPMIPRFFDE